MIIISLGKFRKKPTKKGAARAQRLFARLAKDRVKVRDVYWTLGKYDTVLIAEVDSEKAAMKGALRFADILSTQTLIALKRKDAVKLLE